MIRTLRHGESPPEGVQPRRYVNSTGYMRLRWPLGNGDFVECYEHRWVMGNPPPGIEVHHINHIRDDNRPENLKMVTPKEHGAEHRTIDRAEARRLYVEEGLSTVEVGERMGHNNAAIYRALVGEGVRIRGAGEANRLPDEDVPLEDIRFLHGRGVRARRIANLFGVSSIVIDNRVRELGLTPHRDGRPTNAEIATAQQAIRELIDR